MRTDPAWREIAACGGGERTAEPPGPRLHHAGRPLRCAPLSPCAAPRSARPTARRPSGWATQQTNGTRPRPPADCYSFTCIFDRADGDASDCLTERELDAMDADVALLYVRASRGKPAECRRALGGASCVSREDVAQVWLQCRFPEWV